jgi:prevent-host-death family protein
VTGCAQDDSATGVSLHAPIGIGQLRHGTLHYVRCVAAGDAFDIVRRGKVVARLERYRPKRNTARATGTGNLNPVLMVGLAEIRTKAGRYLDRVSHGDDIAIVHQGRPVAQIIRLRDIHESSTPTATRCE